jgi:hypothetical protein
VAFKWVEGHQDSKNQGHALALDWWALQNIAMDRQVRRHWRQTRHQTPPNIMFSQETYAVLVAGTKLSSFKKQLVHATTNERPIREYWQEKQGISDVLFEDINWKAAQASQRAASLGRRRWQAKYMTSHCATGKMMHIRKQWPHNRCPRCGQAEEDTRHVCQCPEPEARAKAQELLTALNKWLAKSKTQPQIQAHLLLILRRWIANEPPPKGSTTRLGKALQAQATLGGVEHHPGPHQQAADRSPDQALPKVWVHEDRAQVGGGAHPTPTQLFMGHVGAQKLCAAQGPNPPLHP